VLGPDDVTQIADSAGSGDIQLTSWAEMVVTSAMDAAIRAQLVVVARSAAHHEGLGQVPT